MHNIKSVPLHFSIVVLVSVEHSTLPSTTVPEEEDHNECKNAKLLPYTVVNQSVSTYSTVLWALRAGSGRACRVRSKEFNHETTQWVTFVWAHPNHNLLTTGILLY
jgi:hypothetical protein